MYPMPVLLQRGTTQRHACTHAWKPHACPSQPGPPKPAPPATANILTRCCRRHARLLAVAGGELDLRSIVGLTQLRLLKLLGPHPGVRAAVSPASDLRALGTLTALVWLALHMGPGLLSLTPKAQVRSERPTFACCCVSA